MANTLVSPSCSLDTTKTIRGNAPNACQPVTRSRGFLPVPVVPPNICTLPLASFYCAIITIAF
ncbi:hypothetical protein [Entomomonas asaccharolytica]|uniref:Uncharacterized protein n=1 Tax=Entomomonas asaccharolytica TaxID=2785331 RepID=A0A974NDT8_9GAMM|nr:hypothetical protein [Entomomonas asaccharolytica]QQP84542.1 hypothetical protein JHT90_08955 [Entomomonas asaccharolytica]